MADKLQTETGQLSIHTENILPIIKKWLYSDHEIFLRELVSNASDAITKLNHLAGLGEFKGDAGDNRIDIAIDNDAKTITISDNGVGMTADEVKKYINQIAFSGAEEFLSKYKQDDEKSQIIGHFGLGFYSAYMVSDLVEIHTKSHQDKSEAVHWKSDGSNSFEIGPSDKENIGTDIIVHVNDDNAEFLDQGKIRQLLTKYCKYYPVPVFLHESKTDPDDDSKTTIQPVQVNDTTPIWTRNPQDLSDDDYREFYRHEFPLKDDPLFWVHIHVDYPFKINGILYFPKLGNNFDYNKSEISLYCNQVFVTDQTQDLIPEYLHLLHGVIDSDDIPLNVSRSYLQSDGRVKKIAGHIAKKVADKLKALFNTERDEYQNYWDDIHPFVKFGMIRDEDFLNRTKEITLFKSTNENYYTLAEYKEKFLASNMNKDNKCVILYTSDPKQQAAYLKSAADRDYEVIVMDHMIDTHFITNVESKLDDYKFTRIDSNTIDKLIDKDDDSTESVSESETNELKKIFQDVLENDKLDVRVEKMNDAHIPAIIVSSEEGRRMQEMMMMMNPSGQSMEDMFGGNTLVLNHSNKIIERIRNLWELDAEKAGGFVRQVYDLATLTQKPLDGERLTEFISRSSRYLEDVN